MSKIGIDIVKIKRVKITDKFVVKFLSVNELNIFNSFDNKKRKQEFAAGRWAVKEAIIKCTPHKITANKIDIQYDKNGAPFIATKGFEKYSISISHESKYSVAMAINEGE